LHPNHLRAGAWFGFFLLFCFSPIRIFGGGTIRPWFWVFLPVGLAYHALFSIGCALLGWLAISKAWPTELEAFADEKEETDLSEN